MKHLASRRLPALIVVAAATISALLLWSRRHYVPIFDGWIYADCIQRAALHPAELSGYRCAGHISESYVMLMAVAARLAPGAPAALLLGNVLLFALGALALARLARDVFPGEEHAAGRALVVGAFLLHPVVLAAVVQPGLDLALLVFSLCALTAAIERRRWWMIAFGVLLIFAKEPGVVLYGALVAVWLWRQCAPKLSRDDSARLGLAALLFIAFLALLQHEYPSAIVVLVAAVIAARRTLRPAQPLQPGLGRVLRDEWPLAIPLVLLVAYLATYSLRAAAAASGPNAQPAVWGGGGGPIMLVNALIRGGVVDPATYSALALMFVVGFLWVPTLWLVVDLIVGAVRRVRGAPARPLAGVERPALEYVVVVLLADVWLLTRFVTFSNARYYLPVFPLALLAAYAALVRLQLRPAVRAALMTGAAALLALSTVRTIDPVSRAIWGTFPVGDHALLSVTSLRKECCGHGRDQLAYNLQFTEFAGLQDELYQRIRPSDTTVLVVPNEGDWCTVDRLDSATARRTLHRRGSFRPEVIPADQAGNLRRESAWYIQMPFTTDTVFRTQLTHSYEFGEPDSVRRNGYALAYREMRLRGASVGRPSLAARSAGKIAEPIGCTRPAPSAN
ncbi:MAG TPA: hypothetical protein VL328_15295 [Gemmatimonadaceae bacterium]|nr:hypothetical protein [Gemmatimonadaceae bacterium]